MIIYAKCANWIWPTCYLKGLADWECYHIVREDVLIFFSKSVLLYSKQNGSRVGTICWACEENTDVPRWQGVTQGQSCRCPAATQHQPGKRFTAWASNIFICYVWFLSGFTLKITRFCRLRLRRRGLMSRKVIAYHQQRRKGVIIWGGGGKKRGKWWPPPRSHWSPPPPPVDFSQSTEDSQESSAVLRKRLLESKLPVSNTVQQM